MADFKSIKKELIEHSNPVYAKHHTQFFKAIPGGYGEGDAFLGLRVPDQHEISKKYFKEITLTETEKLLRDGFHECRLTALFILVLKYASAKSEGEKTAIVDLYLANISHVNNWDLVDSSAHKILGPYFEKRERKLLYTFACSRDLWKERIAILTTFHFIRKKQFGDSLKIAALLLQHPHDLIHKAVGWMLREIGNRDFEKEFEFLRKHYHKMPRTMLRYAIEKFPENIRLQFLKGTIEG